MFISLKIWQEYHLCHTRCCKNLMGLKVVLLEKSDDDVILKLAVELTSYHAFPNQTFNVIRTRYDRRFMLSTLVIKSKLSPFIKFTAISIMAT